MFKYIVACSIFLSVAASSLAQGQGWTPFRPPPPIPEHGVAALTDDPAYPKYREIYAMIQVNYGSEAGLEPAARAIAALQKDYPNSPYPLFALAEYKYALDNQGSGNQVEIGAILDRVMRGNGANLPDGYILRAKISAQGGYGSAALADAEVAVRFAPNKPESQFALARAQQISKNYPAAEEAYRRFLVLEKDPKRQSNIYWWMARMFSNTDISRAERESYRPKAKEAFRKAMELNPKYDRYLNYGIFLLTEMGDTAESAQCFARMWKDYPDDGETRYLMALLEYLKWAKTGPNGGSLAALDMVQQRTGMPKEHAFVVSAGFDGLAPVSLAMLHAKAISNANAVVAETPLVLPSNATALINATNNDNLPLAKELVERGANVNAQASDRSTPLIFALYHRDAELATYLLKKGARVNVSDADGTSPLELAVRDSAHSRQLVSLLLKYKADPKTVNAQGQSVALLAVMNDNIDALDVLLSEGGVSVDTKDSYGTLLAYCYSDPVMVRYLLSKGANPWADLGGMDIVESAKSAVPFSDIEATKKRLAESVVLLEEARKQRPKK